MHINRFFLITMAMAFSYNFNGFLESVCCAIVFNKIFQNGAPIPGAGSALVKTITRSPKFGNLPNFQPLTSLRLKVFHRAMQRCIVPQTRAQPKFLPWLKRPERRCHANSRNAAKPSIHGKNNAARHAGSTTMRRPLGAYGPHQSNEGETRGFETPPIKLWP